jgi:hypothetical protein
MRKVVRKPRASIGEENEKSLHASLKQWYAQPGDKLEHKVGRYYIDIYREGLLIEIQTRNLGALKRKLIALLEDYNIRLVYPIARDKHIHYYQPGKKKPYKIRKSPKTGNLIDIFDEIIHLPGDILAHPNFSLSALFIHEEEVRCEDGKGSWRRKGISIKDRRLTQIYEEKLFHQPADYLEFLPKKLKFPFSNKELADAMNIRIHDARKITYTFKQMQLIRLDHKKGNQQYFVVSAKN